MTSRPPTSPATSPPSSLERIKARVYLVCCVLGLPLLLLSWLPELPETSNVVQNYLGFPLMLGFLLWFLYGLLSPRVALERLEKQVLPVIGFFFLLQVGSGAFLSQDPEEYARNIWTLMVLTPISYLIRPLREVGTWVALFHSGFVVMPWLRVLLGIPFEGELVGLLLVQLSSGAVLSLMYVQARFREMLLSEQLERRSLQQLAYVDPLTGAANRRRMYDLLSAAGASSRLGGSIVLFDLDHFKRLNDRHGHNAGDTVLRRVAELVRGTIRASDELGRWGGEELLLFLPDTSLEQASRIAERLRADISGLPLEALGQLTASFGVATVHPGERVEGWVDRADQALYQAKQQGRNTVRVAQPPPAESG